MSLFIQFTKYLWADSAFQAFLGVALGFAGALALEKNRKPKLNLKLLETIDHQNPIKFRSVAVALCNAKPGKLTSWFTHREAANAASAQIRFYCDDGRVYLSNLMPGRWAGSPQPPEVALANGQVTPYALLAMSYKEIFPGIDEQVDISVRFPGEDECYGFANSSYFQRTWGKDSNFKLDKGRYIVEVQISHTGGTLVKRFMLRNDVPFSDFRLEEL
jgi:hypothetical protein